jgi:hypothetical protein
MVLSLKGIRHSGRPLLRCPIFTFLQPFAPRPLRRFLATMAALTPARARPLPVRSQSSSRSQPAGRSPCFTCMAVNPVPSPTTQWRHPLAFARYPSAVSTSASVGAGGAGLRQSLADSPPHQAESRSSLSYGPESHLPLLRTPPRGDALMFGYRPESACLTRTSTSLSMHARRRTRDGPLGRLRGARSDA